MSLTNTRLEHTVSFPKDESEWHSWLDGYVQEALTVREFIENLPDTAATFKPTDIDISIDVQRRNHLLKLAGAWPAPETVTNSSTPKWINPNATDAIRYSDAVTKCACGVPMLYQKFSEGEQQPTHHQEHKSNCLKPDRLEARARILRNRREIILEAYNYGHAPNTWRDRLGVKSRVVGGSMWRELNIDGTQKGHEMRERMAKTAIVLSREYSPKTIGRLFGQSADMIKQLLRKETDIDPMTLYKHRRKYA